MRRVMVWFTHFGEQFLGRFDPKTGKVSEYPAAGASSPAIRVGTLDLETDKAGNLWVAMMYQGGVARFDKKTRNVRDLDGAEGVADRRDPAGAS